VQRQDRRQLRLFVRSDDYSRYLSFMFYLPRERYNTDARERFQRILLTATEVVSIDFTAHVGESLLARLHFVVRLAPEVDVPSLDVPDLETRLDAATRTWRDDFGDMLVE